MDVIHGGDVYRHSVAYDFSVNINPLGMPPSSIDAAKDAVLLSSLHYPDCRGERLCKALSKKNGIKSSQIVLGNGAAELIYALCQFLRPGIGRLTAPAFMEYEQALHSAGAKIELWELKEEEDFALGEAFVDSIRGDGEIVFLCNPNNPTGSVVGKTLLQNVAKRCEETGAFFCLDECFLPFLEPEQHRELSMLKKLEQYPHLIVLRAFTKIYAMPGLRIGYACSANRELLDGIRSVLQPWNTSIPAQEAAFAALEDEEYLRRTHALLAEERQYLLRELSSGLADKVYPPGANFIFFRSRADLQQRLLEKGILIRSCANYRNLCDGYFRIAVRSHEENQELIRRWREAVR